MRLASIFSPRMIFQQNEPFSVWGSGCSSILDARLINIANKKEVTPVSIKYEGDDFNIVFPPIVGSFDPYCLKVCSKEETIEVSPVFCGDLFLFVGQSNLSISLSLMEDKDETIDKCKEKELYILNVIDEDVTKEGYINRPISPKKDLFNKCKWEKLEGEVLLKSSALLSMVLYRLSINLNYPLGAISASTGGISIDSFLDEKTIEETPEIKSFLIGSGKYIFDKSKWNGFGTLNYTQQSGFYNEKIAPLKGIKFKSIVYYQGENSCFDFESGQYFRSAFTHLVSSYREYFGQDIPFVALGIADEYYPYGDGCGLFYIQEVISSLSIRNVFYVPVFDIFPKWLIKDGNQIDHPIHTVRKGEVASRISFVLKQNVYGSNGFSYPRIKNVLLEDNSILLELDIKGDELNAGDTYFGFTIANEDKTFYLAKAISISPNSIRLSSPYVDKPVYFTYAFTHYSYLCNCKSKKGYPLSPCRNFCSRVDKKKFDLDYIVSSLNFPFVMENNFGASVGGGFLVPTFEKGEYIRNQVGEVEISNGEGTYSTYFGNDSYFYTSISFNLGISGCFHRLAYFPYLSIDIKSDEDITFLGALFRANGNILKFDSINKNVSSTYKTFYIDLNRILDGSETPFCLDKAIIDSLSKIEFYFHSTHETKANICFKNIHVLNKMEKEDKSEKECNVSDASLQLPRR